MLKKLANWVLYLSIVGLSTLLLLEACYRYYVVDFYGGSLRGLNTVQMLAPTAEQPTMLVIGDSFSADTSSYVKQLRAGFPAWRVINSAVPGTSIRQHRTWAKARIEAFEPEVLVYQIYVGNDLLEYRHPTTGAGISDLRKVYWWLADRLLVVGYINAKLPGLRAMFRQTTHPGLGAKLAADFNPVHYSQRAKIQLAAAPALWSNSVLLKGEQGEAFAAYIEEVEALLALAPSNCEVAVLVIPHCVQLGEPYLTRMEQLGAVFFDQEAISQRSYPFYEQLEQVLSTDNRHFINALSYLPQPSMETPVYYENDPHLNPQGQQLLGDSLVMFLEKVMNGK